MLFTSKLMSTIAKWMSIVVFQWFNMLSTLKEDIYIPKNYIQNTLERLRC